MLSPTRVVYQSLVNAGNDGRLEVGVFKMSALNEDHADLRTLVERNEGRPLGLSCTFLPNGTLQVLAVADATTVILVDFAGDKNNGRGANSSDPSLAAQGRDYLRDHVLGRGCGFLYAFDMAPLALALWQSHDLRIKQAIDLQSAGPPMTRAPRATVEFATGGQKVLKDNVTRVFNSFICEEPGDAAKSSTVTPLAQRAWAAHYISQLDPFESRLSQVPPIDTTKLSDTLLRFLAKSTADSFQRDQLKPTEVTRAFAATFDDREKQLRVKADRYQNKIRKGRNQQVDIHVAAFNGVGSFSVSAKIASASGAVAKLETEGLLAGKPVATITLMGREDPTTAEVKRAQVILMVLQGTISTDGPDFNPWIHKIYLNPGSDFMWPAEWSQPTPSHLRVNPDKIPRPLNSSQRKAINCMLDQTDASRITIIQGPPGTGKTTVIASYVLTAVSAGRTGIWLIAQSNIAVKNIAEKLAAFDLLNWRLLVSNDFYAFWHEHLYHSIKANIITSGEFPFGRLSELYGCPVILCTLSMLSSDILKRQGAFRRAPLHTVIVDEASQIEVGDYISLFTNFTTIRKAVFIGDNMQLPPHGQDDIQDLQSVFELDHLIKQDFASGKNPIIFLDTQYRMPPQIGNFIAQTVYPSKDEDGDSEPLLKSSDHHPLADADSLLCYFVNVLGDQISHGTSWKNLEECKAIVQLATIFQAEGKNFKIITPYDAQRSLVEEELKKADLEWGDKCFNVDSFQGNEEDYIIISLVRSRDLGFLADKRRVNVMLSRCKRGMIIFTSKAYIEKYAGSGKSLIGELICDYYEHSAWIEVGDLEKTPIV